MTKAEAGIGWKQRAHWPPPNILSRRRNQKGVKGQEVSTDAAGDPRLIPKPEEYKLFKTVLKKQSDHFYKKNKTQCGEWFLWPAVVLLAVDVSISPVEWGVRLQLTLTLAAAEADTVPHTACSQEEETVAHLLPAAGTRYWPLDGHSCRSLRQIDRQIYLDEIAVMTCFHY